MLRLATSGFHTNAGATRSVTGMNGDPPVVKLTTTSDRALISRKNGAKASGDWSGRPSAGLRACKCTMAAPACAAPTAASAISLAVTGRLGDIDGVWIEPVTAHVMMILLAFAISHPRKPWSTGADLADQIERECAFTSPVELIHDSIILQHSILNVTKQRISRDAKTSGCNQWPHACHGEFTRRFQDAQH